MATEQVEKQLFMSQESVSDAPTFLDALTSILLQSKSCPWVVHRDREPVADGTNDVCNHQADGCAEYNGLLTS